jgi:Na+/H+ antiporter NhaC
MKHHLITAFVLLFGCYPTLFAQSSAERVGFSADANGVYIQDEASAGDSLSWIVNGQDTALALDGGRAFLPVETDDVGRLLFIQGEVGQPVLFHYSLREGRPRLRRIPLWLSIVPPLLAIAMALLLREVILSLVAGIWAGAFIAGGLRLDSFYHFLMSFLDVLDHYIIQALTDSAHLSIILFSLLIGGMVAVISRNGGMAGIVERLSAYARSARSTQFITWLLGVAIFFDDYANTLIVGNTMRPVTDRFRISREKLAYLVDSTAAPVAAIAFITTWIGAELSYIDDGIADIPLLSGSYSAYAVFLESLKYSFYPLLTLAFLLMIVWTGRDYGPMHLAETRARLTGRVWEQGGKSGGEEDDDDMENLNPVASAPHRWYNAAVSVVVVILLTLYGLLQTGMEGSWKELAAKGFVPPDRSWGAVWSTLADAEGTEGFFILLGKVIGNADSYVALLWSSLLGVVTALLLTLGQRIMNLYRSMNTLVTGFKTMAPALIILSLAWALALTTKELHTASFLSFALGDALNPLFLPAIVFVLAAFISFSTGSSWSTMAILYPIAIPTTWTICQAAGLDEAHSKEILFNVISIVLGASVLGDHCSPISDTTILSSLASHCNHIDHVRTQLPYALTVGAVSIVLGTLSTALGGGWGLSFGLGLAGMAVLFGLVRWQGKPLPERAGH